MKIKNKVVPYVLACASVLSLPVFAQFHDSVPKSYESAEATIRYVNGSVNYSFTKEDENLVKISEKARLLHLVEKSVGRDIKRDIREQIAGKLSLTTFRFNIDGQLKIDLVGKPNGTIEARVGNISVSGFARLRKNSFAKAKVNISSNKLYITGTYNPITGKLDNLRVNDGFKVDVDVDVDSFLDLIPGFNYFVTNKIEAKFSSQFEQQIKSSLNDRVNGYEDVLFGLDRYLPKNTYVYRGKDYAVELENAFKDLVSGESISITVYHDYLRLRNNEDYALGHLKVNISNHLYLHVYDKPYVKTEWISQCEIIGEGEVCTSEP